MRKLERHHNVKQCKKYDKRFNDDMGKETGSQAKTKAKTHAQNQAKKTANRSSKIRHTADGKKSVKNAIHAVSPKKLTDGIYLIYAI